MLKGSEGDKRERVERGGEGQTKPQGQKEREIYIYTREEWLGMKGVFI